MLGTNIGTDIDAGVGTPMSATEAASDPRGILGSDLILDLDSDLGITQSSGVSAWEDQSGRGNNVSQNTSGNRLAYATNVTDGHAAVRGTGVNDYLTGAMAGMGAGSRPTVWVVAALPASAQSCWVETSDVTGSGNRGLLMYRDNLRPSWAVRTGAVPGFTVIDTGGYTPTSISLFRGTLTPGERIELYENEMFRSSNTLGTKTGGLTSEQTQVSVGLLYAGVYPLYADLFRLIISKGAPTQAQVDAMAVYLDARYPSCGLLSSGVIFLAGQSNASNTELGTENPLLTGFLWDQRGVFGTALSYWTAGNTGYDNLVHAIDRIPSNKPVTVAWIQGESDCTVPLSAVYQANFITMQSAIATATGRSDIYWVDVQLHASSTSGDASGRAGLRTAKTNLAGLGLTTLLNCDDVTLTDGVHWNAAGRITMMGRIRDAVVTHYGL